MIEFTPNNVLLAYRQGVFPMAEPDTEAVYWFKPDPRAIIPIGSFHVSRSLRRFLRSMPFTVTYDQGFEAVMRGCARRDETWISEEFVQVYGKLHEMGYAHSVEVWEREELVGGTYGIAIGAAFMAESMFRTRTNASKVALTALVDRLSERGFKLLDVQFLTPHLESLGAVEISCARYLRLLTQAASQPVVF